jgi:acyl carrier protein
MNRIEIEAALEQAIHRIAPEADLAAVDRDSDFREQIDIDSFDFLNVVIGLHEALGVDIPESDYPKLTTINSAVTYLETAKR